MRTTMRKQTPKYFQKLMWYILHKNCKDFLFTKIHFSEMISQHWHGESWSAAPGVSFSPHRGHSFDLGVEVETLGTNTQCCLDCIQSGLTKTEPASRRSLCHRGSCLGTRWRTSLAGEPGWGHSLQPNNGNFVNFFDHPGLNKISWSMSVKPVQHLCLQWTSLQLHRWLWKLQFHFLRKYFLYNKCFAFQFLKP